MEDTRYAHHRNGIHLACKPIKMQRVGTASGVIYRKPSKSEQDDNNCQYAGGIEMFHSHDFDGPLPCDCEDF